MRSASLRTAPHWTGDRSVSAMAAAAGSASSASSASTRKAMPTPRTSGAPAVSVRLLLPLLLLGLCCRACLAAVWVWEFTKSVPRVEEGPLVQGGSGGGVLSENCFQQVGVTTNGVHNSTMPNYNLTQVLESLGGLPGKVNYTRVEPGTPLPPPDFKDLGTGFGLDTNYYEDPADELLYDYRASDYKSWVRVERGVLRRRPGGSARDEPQLDVQGELFWTPPDFCAFARHAAYRSNSTGFHARIAHEYCYIRAASQDLWCATAPYCYSNATYRACVG